MSLTISVYSFSFKKGIPTSENGGGYVFDCRGMENPGRYEQYKSLTGNDAPVIGFLEQKGQVQTYLEGIENIVAPHIRNYIERDLTDLMVCFGCTGGQHRSVYCAEHFAAWAHENFPEATVHLIHREQNIDRIL